MASVILTKNHVTHSIQDRAGNIDINYFQNTLEDVIFDDDNEETLRGHITYYANCTTDAATAKKEISVVGGKTDVLSPGCFFSVTFEKGNSAEPVTLTVNGKGKYTIEGVTATSIVPNQTVTLIFTGSKFIISGASGVPIAQEEVVGKSTNNETRYMTFVDGVTGSAKFKIDPNVKINKEGLTTKVSNSTVDFDPAAAELNKDVRSANILSKGDSLTTLMKKIRHIFDALGALAFRANIGTAQLDTTLSDDYNLTLHKSGTINGTAVNDLFNGTNFSGAPHTKALDATVGLTLQNQIDTINSDITTINNTINSFSNTKGDIVGSPLGVALSMSTTWTWTQVVNAIKGVVNRGAVSKEFTPSASEQTYTVPKGYHNGSGVVKCKAISLTGNASTAHVLSGITYYSNSLTLQTGTMPNRSSMSTSGAMRINPDWPNCPIFEGSSTQWSWDNNRGSYLAVCPPYGYYPGSGSGYVGIPASSLGTAGTGDILSGKTATSQNGYGITGTIPNRTSNTGTANLSWAGDSNGSPYNGTSAPPYMTTSGDQLRVKIPYGYYGSGSSLVLTGTVKGNLNWKPGNGTTYTVPSGYYTGGTLDSTDAYNAGYNAGKTDGITEGSASASGTIDGITADRMVSNERSNSVKVKLENLPANSGLAIDYCIATGSTKPWALATTISTGSFVLITDLKGGIGANSATWRLRVFTLKNCQGATFTTKLGNGSGETSGTNYRVLRFYY